MGHTGTLDPMATGVLVVCLGQATRIVEYLMAGRKEYVAGVTFGVRTDSQDSTGVVLDSSDASDLSEKDLQAVLPGFRGVIRQIPPMVSAVHHEGKRLYELARKGVEVERAAREVEIYRLELKDFTPGVRPHAILEVECSTGTYIRTLASDIGDALGVGATMGSLRRIRSGRFTLEQAAILDELELGSATDSVRSITEALSDWPHVRLTLEQLERITHGNGIRYSVEESRPHLLVDQLGNAVAVAVPRGPDLLAPVKVLRS